MLHEISCAGVALFFKPPYGPVILHHAHTTSEKGHETRTLVV